MGAQTLHRRLARRGGAGFTVVEILIAVAVTAVGFAAIFSMQIGTMQGNIAAREMASAVNLAERYAEDLRRDTYAWTNSFVRPGPRLNRELSRWHSLTEDPVDHNGRASAQNDAQFGSPLPRQRFCAHYWMGPPENGLINGRVRVIWPRSSVDASGLIDVCPEARADGFEEDVSLWYTVTVPVVLRQSPSEGGGR